MLSVYKYKDTTWDDLTEPSTEEVAELTKKYNIDPLVAHELTSPTLRHRAEARKNYIYLVFHFPESRKGLESAEIDFVIGPDYLITTHYTQIDALDRFAKSVEVDSIIDRRRPGNARDLIFFGLMREILGDVNDGLSHLSDDLRDIQQRIFKGKEKEMVFALSEVSRQLLDYRKTTLPYHEILRTLEIEGEKLFGEDFGFAARDLVEEFGKSEANLHAALDSVRELRETNNSLLTTKQNSLMRTLTYFSLITSVLIGFALVWLGYLAVK